MKTLEKISQHYQKAIAGDMEKIEVPEWDMEIYCRRTYPFKDEAKVIELQAQGKTVEALVESLIVKALDKDGKKIFREADRINLMNEADPAVIIKIAGQINNIGMRQPLETLAKE
jgi:pseudouridine-5'-phosphate glycosidase